MITEIDFLKVFDLLEDEVSIMDRAHLAEDCWRLAKKLAKQEAEKAFDAGMNYGQDVEYMASMGSMSDVTEPDKETYINNLFN